jgi:hypothetical protein
VNIYTVVEGEIGERYVYEKWIPFINPTLSFVNDIFEIKNDNFAIIAGMGLPFTFEVIEDAIQDVNTVGNIDRFVIAIDSEDMSFDEKLEEVREFLADKPCIAEIKIIIQHFCLETWALGNKKVGPRKPKDLTLSEYKRVFNVLEKDPELLPAYKGLNRAQFALIYLRKMLNDKNRNLTYTKNNPKALLYETYFNEIKKRHDDSDHILSFSTLLDAFT